MKCKVCQAKATHQIGIIHQGGWSEDKYYCYYHAYSIMKEPEDEAFVVGYTISYYNTTYLLKFIIEEVELYEPKELIL